MTNETGLAPAATAAKSQRMESVDFLIKWDRSGPWVLTAIKPDGPIETSSFYPDEEFDAARWITSHQSRGWNLYFHVNRPSRILVKKATKTDIRFALAMHADIDPSPELTRPQILAALQAYEPTPTIIIDSGNGYQAYWRISPDPDLARAEAASRYIQSRLPGADQVHSIDHIMRLPGTTNYPSAKKIARGRTITRSSLVSANWLYLHDITTMPRLGSDPADPSSAPREYVWPAHLPIGDLLNPKFVPDLVDGPSPPGVMTEQEAAQEAIDAAVRRVANTTENRNNKLAQEAFLCGTRLTLSGLNEEDIYQELFDAIPGLDRNLRKDSDTIRRQLREGQRRPESHDPRIRELHKMAHDLLEDNELTPVSYLKAVRLANADLLPEPLPPNQVEKIAARAREVHTNGG